MMRDFSVDSALNGAKGSPCVGSDMGMIERRVVTAALVCYSMYIYGDDKGSYFEGHHGRDLPVPSSLSLITELCLLHSDHTGKKGRRISSYHLQLHRVVVVVMYS